jgi:hypothetical protein
MINVILNIIVHSEKEWLFVPSLPRGGLCKQRSDHHFEFLVTFVAGFVKGKLE